MISANDVSLIFGDRTLFKDVSIRFLPGNCYGLIGANGAGKSTFLRVLAGQIEPTSGAIEIGKKERIGVLEQNQFAYEEYTVLQTVILGYKELYALNQQREAIYSKADFSEEDGIFAAQLEIEFAEIGGYESESDAAILLKGLGVGEDLHSRLMRELDASVKVRVLLAQALFGNPDILLLDEPTNQLDLGSIRWLEEFLGRFENTVIVVSHDRHFLNAVCTHIADVDFKQIRLYTGNYDFWYRASQLIAKQRKDQGKKREEKIKELQEFIMRFRANVAKSKQTTARKKMIDRLSVDEFPETSRKFPYVDFKPERPVGRVIVEVDDLTISFDDEPILRDFRFTVEPGDKIAFVGSNDLIKTLFFDTLMGEHKQDSGTIHWGQTITPAYFPKENSKFFNTDLTVVEWLSQYTNSEDESYIRGFLGRMLFSGEEALKPSNVLSGGEKVRCMLSRMMLSGANVLILDEPTNHLDLEAITSLNDGLVKFSEVILFSSHDFEFINTVANRIVELMPNGYIDRRMPFNEYIEDAEVKALRTQLYSAEKAGQF